MIDKVEIIERLGECEDDLSDVMDEIWCVMRDSDLIFYNEMSAIDTVRKVFRDVGDRLEKDVKDEREVRDEDACGVAILLLEGAKAAVGDVNAGHSCWVRRDIERCINALKVV